MKIAIIIQSLSNVEKYAPKTTSNNMMEDRLSTRNHVKMLPLEESRRLTNCEVNNNHDKDQPETATLAVSRRQQATKKNGIKSTLGCNNYHKTVHFPRDFRARKQESTNYENIGPGRFPKTLRSGRQDTSEKGNYGTKCFIARKLNNVNNASEGRLTTHTLPR